MGKTVHTEAVRDLFEAILTLETEEECFNFFEDVCTVNELLSIAQRFAVAKMLKEDNTYLEVAEKTGASTATISRVNRSLNYGKDGYELVFSRMYLENEKKVSELQHLKQEILRIWFYLIHSRRIFVFCPTTNLCLRRHCGKQSTVQMTRFNFYKLHISDSQIFLC